MYSINTNKVKDIVMKYLVTLKHNVGPVSADVKFIMEKDSMFEMEEYMFFHPVYCDSDYEITEDPDKKGFLTRR